MNTVAAVMALLAGIILIGLAMVILADLTRRRSLVGAALAAAALVNGLHDLIHGVAVLRGGANSGVEMLSLLLGLPFLGFYVGLRLRGRRGRSGDLELDGAIGAVVLAALAVAASSSALLVAAYQSGEGIEVRQLVLGAVQAAAYLLAGWMLFQSQWSRHRSQGTWSASGLCLVGLVSTWAVVPLVHGLGAASQGTSLTLVLAAGVPASLALLGASWLTARRARTGWARRPAMIRVRDSGAPPWAAVSADDALVVEGSS